MCTGRLFQTLLGNEPKTPKLKVLEERLSQGRRFIPLTSLGLNQGRLQAQLEAEPRVFLRLSRAGWRLVGRCDLEAQGKWDELGFIKLPSAKAPHESP